MISSSLDANNNNTNATESSKMTADLKSKLCLQLANFQSMLDDMLKIEPDNEQKVKFFCAALTGDVQVNGQI